MKKEKNDIDYVTKTDFRVIVEEIVDRSAFRVIHEIIDYCNKTFATKTELAKAKDELKTELKTELRAELRGDIIQFKDDILREIIDLRDDVTAICGRGGIRTLV